MNLLEIVREDVDGLPPGAHVDGLRSVIRHIAAAEAHLTRGREQKDESAFTDAIYRSNQAFEGSIKEAYRVLAGKDPAGTSIFTIENYLQKNRVFRDRVLAQFKNYRTQWRNPSTHDYNLDFDDDEALLAIVSVSAFAKLLVDQMSEHIAFEAAKDDLIDNPPPAAKTVATAPLFDRVNSLMQGFVVKYLPTHNVPLEREAQVLGTLAAYLSVMDHSLKVVVEQPVQSSGRRLFVDLLIEDEEAKVVVEIKRAVFSAVKDEHLAQVATYIAATGAEGGVLFYFGLREEPYILKQYDLPNSPHRLSVLGPSRVVKPQDT